MTKQFLMIAAATLTIGTAAINDTAQAAVAGPAGAIRSSAQSLNSAEQVRRVCRPVFQCGKFPQGCRWQQKCHVTGDYPPEHGRR